MIHWNDFLWGIVCGVLLTLVFNDVRRKVKEAIAKQEISGGLAIMLYALQQVWLPVSLWIVVFSPIKLFRHHGEVTTATLIASTVMNLVSYFFGKYLIDKALIIVKRTNPIIDKGITSS